MIQEISRTSLPITRNEEASLSWHNSVLTVRTEKDIILYDFSLNLQCLDKKIDLVSCSMPVPKRSPMTGLIPDHFLKEGVSNLAYTEMILDPSLWPHNPELVQEMTNVADVQLSPPGAIVGNECALAVLNNIGNVLVFRRGRYEWIKVLDLSEIIKQRYFSSGKQNIPKTIEQLKQLAYSIETSSVCWRPNAGNNSSIFVTAQKNGNILLWKLLYKTHEMSAELIGEVNTEFGEVVGMVWIPKSDDDFVIICSNIYGQIFALELQVPENKITTLWKQKDKMVTKYICYSKIDDKIVLFCNKHRHLLTLIIDKNCEVLDLYIENVNDFRITDIKSNEHGIYLTTVNCKIYRITTKVLASGKIDFTLEPIQMNELSPSIELYSISASTNNVIWALALKDRKVFHRQRAQKFIDIVFFYNTNPSHNELNILLNNKTQKLTDYWDCIELLRYKTIKTKTLPLIDYDKFYKEAEKNIYQLKLYYIFLNFFHNLEKRLYNGSRNMLPETSLDVVKEKIMALHATQIITETYEKSKHRNEILDNLQIQSYFGAQHYVLNYHSKYKEIEQVESLKNMIQYLSFLPEIEDKSFCQGCDEEIQGFTCTNGHFNMFCSVTFTIIDSYEYLVCRSCGSTANIELYPNNPTCIFCDLYLSNLHLPV